MAGEEVVDGLREPFGFRAGSLERTLKFNQGFRGIEEEITGNVDVA